MGDFDLPEFLSEEAKSLISGLLTTSPGKRINIDSVYKHDWFKKDCFPRRRGIYGVNTVYLVDENVLSCLPLSVEGKIQTVRDVNKNKFSELTCLYMLTLKQKCKDKEGKYSNLDSDSFEKLLDKGIKFESQNKIMIQRLNRDAKQTDKAREKVLFGRFDKFLSPEVPKRGKSAVGKRKTAFTSKIASKMRKSTSPAEKIKIRDKPSFSRYNPSISTRSRSPQINPPKELIWLIKAYRLSSILKELANILKNQGFAPKRYPNRITVSSTNSKLSIDTDNWGEETRIKLSFQNWSVPEISKLFRSIKQTLIEAS